MDQASGSGAVRSSADDSPVVGSAMRRGVSWRMAITSSTVSSCLGISPPARVRDQFRK